MSGIRKIASFTWVALAFCVIARLASAQAPGQLTPCGIAIASDPFFKTAGLVSVSGGFVYDANQGLCWLADANLAGNPVARHLLSPFIAPTNPDPEKDGATVPVINADGTMDYETALNWVNALNKFDGGKGWLNHNNWQLPTSTHVDNNCSSNNDGNNFGALCTASAMPNLYNLGLARTYPDSVVPHFLSWVWPFVNLQPGLYWSGTSAQDAGYSTFSFNTGDQGANTTDYNFLHVLPMTPDLLGPIPPGPGVVRPYLFGPGAGKAVYDSNTKLSWTLDANLAATEDFGFNGTIVLETNPSDPNVNHAAFPMTVPIINKDGAMHFSGVCGLKTNVDCPPPATGWIVSMNGQNYAGSSHWALPGIQDLINLYADLALSVGDPRLEWRFWVGPFNGLQPGFYWSCMRDDNTTNNQAACDLSLHPQEKGTQPMEYSFNFDDGFQGTDQANKHFYVMVYFPAPTKP